MIWSRSSWRTGANTIGSYWALSSRLWFVYILGFRRPRIQPTSNRRKKNLLTHGATSESSHTKSSLNFTLPCLTVLFLLRERCWSWMVGACVGRGRTARCFVLWAAALVSLSRCAPRHSTPVGSNSHIKPRLSLLSVAGLRRTSSLSLNKLSRRNFLLMFVLF